MKAACACGAATATCTGAPLRVAVCHCTDCRRRTGSAFSWNARFAEHQIEVSGALRAVARTGDEGSTITYYFCPSCGASLYYTNSKISGLVIPVGAFGDVGEFPPDASIYADRCPDWLSVTAPRA